MHTESIGRLIQSVSFHHELVTNGLSAGTMEAIEKASETRSFRDGDILYAQGAVPRGVYRLKSGLVKISSTTPGGYRQLVYVYKQGDWMGYRQNFTSEFYPVEGVAIGNAETTFIPMDEFIRLVKTHHDLSYNLLLTLSQEFSAWVNRTVYLAKFPVRVRLAIGLLFLDAQFRDAGNESGIILFSRTDLADMIGATIETTVRTLGEFKENGWVTARGRTIQVKDRNALFQSIGEL
ncbi:MAG: Crp/Fnr family transcriptional regulator [Bacteroidota bacterium]